MYAINSMRPNDIAAKPKLQPQPKMTANVVSVVIIITTAKVRKAREKS